VKDVILTPEGYKQLTSELDVLRTSRRREVAERIAAAREFGEIAENAEYDDAKNEQMMLEHRIAQLEDEECAAGPDGEYAFYDNEYRWTLEGSTLALATVKNDCPDRVAETILTSQPWTKES